ncbi:MAG: hypothetical protein ABI035_10675 [Gemmatimonadaceae bacterium]
MLSPGKSGPEESRLEDYVVSGLVDFDDVSYDDHAELLYRLAAQVVQHSARTSPTMKYARYSVLLA